MIPPGETLRDKITGMNLSQAELAVRAGISAKHVNQIVHGVAPITLETAIALDRITGIPASVWNHLEANYRETLLRYTASTLSVDDQAWMDSLPINELKRRKILPDEKDRVKLFDALLSFFGVADRVAWDRIWKGQVASFRRSSAYRSAPESVISWLRIAQISAQAVNTEMFSTTKFRKVLSEIRSLTSNGDPNDIVPLCAEAGVVVVFVSEVKGCHISGAAWWASKNRAIISLSDRYKRDDQFWFSFFHEAAHLLMHSKKETFVDDGKDNNIVEEEADTFAANFLIPRNYEELLVTLKTESDVRAFASEIGIAPGIVVGRLQHDRKLDWSQGNNLKRGLRIID